MVEVKLDLRIPTKDLQIRKMHVVETLVLIQHCSSTNTIVAVTLLQYLVA
jgi:hypothetical protein